MNTHNRAILALIALTLLLPTNGYAGSDKYSNFVHLSTSEIRGSDFSITTSDVSSSTLIMAIHGGKIEGGTDQLAKLLGHLGPYNIYTFEGNKASRNRELHITSTRFDEPQAIEMVKKSAITLSIHGYAGKTPDTVIGGRHTAFADIFRDRLKSAGFQVSTNPRLGGVSINNIVNRNLVGGGIQLELSTAQRSAFSDKTVLNRYLLALHEALRDCEAADPIVYPISDTNLQDGFDLEDDTLPLGGSVADDAYYIGDAASDEALAYEAEEERIFYEMFKLLVQISDGQATGPYSPSVPVEPLTSVAYISGFPGNAFKPDDPLSRAQLASMLVRLFSFPASLPEKGPLRDLNPDHWAYQSICAVEGAGLMTRDAANCFNPERAVTHAELFSAFHTAFKGYSAGRIILTQPSEADQKLSGSETLPTSSTSYTRAEGIALINQLMDRSVAHSEPPLFSDVPADHWAYQHIQSARSGGVPNEE